MTLSRVPTNQLSGDLSFRNRIINGGMAIWQRGTSFSVTAGQYVQDRWLIYAPSGTFGSARSTDVPSGFQYSAELTGTDVSYTQRIEAANCFDLAGGSTTVSFWAKSTSGTADLKLVLQYPGASDNWSSITDFDNETVAASPSSSWTYYTATFTGLPAQVANGLGVAIVRGAASASTTRITGVQLEAGPVATPFERRPYGTELALCQRYCYVLDGVDQANWGIGRWENNGTMAYANIIFPVKMRALPTFSLPSTNNLKAVNPTIAWYPVTGINSIHQNGTKSADLQFYAPSGSGLVADKTFTHIACINGAAKLIVQAEL